MQGQNDNNAIIKDKLQYLITSNVYSSAVIL